MPPAESAPRRIASVDALRGVVLVLMALDHARGFFHRDEVLGLDPHDLARVGAAAFGMRWLGWACAPIFSLLAGVGVSLAAARGTPKAALSRSLVARGLLLILLELTVVHFCWTFRLSFETRWGLALWALGWSMIALAALVHLPAWCSVLSGAALIAGHDLFDGVSAERFGAWAPLWTLLHAPGWIAVTPGFDFLAWYPLIPWIGVMAAGYGLGSLLQREQPSRRRWLLSVGAALSAAFVLVRLWNGYGDPAPWTSRPDAITTAMAFLDCRRQPPSLCALLMALGPGVLLLGLLDPGVPRPLRPLVVLGRAPLFFYLLHLPLIHALSFAANLARHGHGDFGWPGAPDPPPDAGFGLGVVLLVWLAVVAALYPACAWFDRREQRRRGVRPVHR